MTWEEMIQKRRQKENEFKQHGLNLKISFDHYQLLLEKGFKFLSPMEERAVFLRFLEALPIARVADHMGMSWDGADALIDYSSEKLRWILQTQILLFKRRGFLWNFF